MRRTVAALIAGLLLGITGTAAAGAKYYWSEGGSGYKCQGVTTGVVCKSGGFSIGITRTFLYVQKGSGDSAPTYACRKWSSWSGCFEG